MFFWLTLHYFVEHRLLSLTDNLLLLHRSSSSIEDVQYSEFVVKMEIGIGQEPNQGHLQKKARVLHIRIGKLM